MIAMDRGRTEKQRRRSAHRLRKDLKLLATFVRVYCRDSHAEAPMAPVELKGYDVEGIVGRPLLLCASCRKLLAHAFVKRSTCPYDPKPSCKKCTTHCYGPAYRQQMRAVMKHSGRRLVMSGRLDYLIHLWF